jgi:CBS domain-containing protein
MSLRHARDLMARYGIRHLPVMEADVLIVRE